jgi:hypothetical protein
MRIVTKDIQLTIDGSSQGFRLTKPDAFSGVEILRLLLRLQDQWGEAEQGDGFARSADAELQNRPRRSAPSVLDLITSLSSEELRSVMTSCLNHTEVLLPAGPHPVMTGSEWGYPELKHDTVSCMKLVLEEITWALEGFFGEGGPDSLPADANTSRPSARTSTSSSSSR